jgi:hypothetical protein
VRTNDIDMQRERLEFVAMLLFSGFWVASAISVPLVYALLMIGNFAVSCPSTESGFIEHWNDYTLPRRVFAFFMCVELLYTRSWCIRDFYVAVQSMRTNYDLIVGASDAAEVRLATTCYLWSSVVTALLLDTGILAWIFFYDKVCADMTHAHTSTHDAAQLRTLQPVCIQTSNVGVVLEIIHIINAALMCLVAICITIVAYRA